MKMENLLKKDPGFDRTLEILFKESRDGLNAKTGSCWGLAGNMSHCLNS